VIKTKINYLLKNLNSLNMSTQHTNSVHLVGNIGKDVQVTTFDSGKKKASISVVTSESYKNLNGENVENNTWHNVVAWGSVADSLVGLSKGTQVEVRGSISNRSYNDKEGNKKYITEINAIQISKK
jgi:single-strand DNA-binding protein